MKGLKKILSSRKALTLAEYAFLLVVTLGAMVAVSVHYQKGLQGKIQAMTDHFIGTQREGRLAPLNVSGGRQLVEPGGMYKISGVTTSFYNRNDLQQNEAGDGSRTLSYTETQQQQSPGGGLAQSEYSLGTLPDFHYEDPEKVPVYVPKRVKAEEGYIFPPKR